MDETQLQDFFFGPENGISIFKCIQCGTCSGSCPLASQMDHGPRELFGLIRQGSMAEALRSNTLWACVSCYNCTARCPREIPVTDLIYSLKRLAIRSGLATPDKSADLYRAFAAEVERHGRVNEPRLMARYGLRRPLNALAQSGLALKLLRRGRLDFRTRRVRNPESLAGLLADKKPAAES